MTAEIGLERRKIAYLGDTLNTTSRLERLAKELGAEIVVSGDLLDRLGDLPGHIRDSELGVRAQPVREERLRSGATGDLTAWRGHSGCSVYPASAARDLVGDAAALVLAVARNAAAAAAC